MTSALHIVTGASRGLGAAIAQQLLQPGVLLLGISRHRNEALAALAAQSAITCEQWALDLAEPVAVAQRLQNWLASLDGSSFDRASLINNAGVITRVGPIDECGNDAVSAALRVGLEAPLLLTAAFLRGTRGWRAQRRVLNISSGLGRRAMAGSAVYCAAKAGMDHFSRAMALDEAERDGGAKVVSLAPGVIDTDMQDQLRAADPAGFPEQANFIKLKESGMLTSAHDAAARVLAYLNRADFGINPVGDVRDA